MNEGFVMQHLWGAGHRRGSRASTECMPRGRNCLYQEFSCHSIPEKICVYSGSEKASSVQWKSSGPLKLCDTQLYGGLRGCTAHTRGGFGLFSPFDLCTSVTSNGALNWFWPDVAESVITRSLLLLSQVMLCLLVSSQRERKRREGLIMLRSLNCQRIVDKKGYRCSTER